MNSSEVQNDNQKPFTKEDYNKLPVYYCKHCGSLKIMTMPGLSDDYCDECGSTDIGKANIDIWLELQKTMFKSPYRDKPEKKFNIFK